MYEGYQPADKYDDDQEFDSLCSLAEKILFISQQDYFSGNNSDLNNPPSRNLDIHTVPFNFKTSLTYFQKLQKYFFYILDCNTSYWKLKHSKTQFKLLNNLKELIYIFLLF